MTYRTITNMCIYNFIADYISAHGYAPTIRELCDGTGLSSTCSMFNRLREMRSNGMIDFIDRSPRTITLKENV